MEITFINLATVDVVKNHGVIYNRTFTNTIGSLVAPFNFHSIFFPKYMGFTTAVVKVPWIGPHVALFLITIQIHWNT